MCDSQFPDTLENKDTSKIFEITYRYILDIIYLIGKSISLRKCFSVIFWTIPSMIQQILVNLPGFFIKSTEGDSIFLFSSNVFVFVFAISIILLITSRFHSRSKKFLALLTKISHFMWLFQIGLFIFHAYLLVQIVYYENFSILDDDGFIDQELKRYYTLDCRKSYDVMAVSILVLIPTYIKSFSDFTNPTRSSAKMLLYSFISFALSVVFGVMPHLYPAYSISFSAQFFRLLYSLAFFYLKLGLESALRH